MTQPAGLHTNIQSKIHYSWSIFQKSLTLQVDAPPSTLNCGRNAPDSRKWVKGQADKDGRAAA